MSKVHKLTSRLIEPAVAHNNRQPHALAQPCFCGL